MEEDIIIANEFAKLTFLYGGKIVFTTEQMKKYQQAIGNLINRNKELERLHISDNKHLDYLMQNSIPTSVIKEKIEELQKKMVKNDKTIVSLRRTIMKNQPENECIISRCRIQNTAFCIAKSYLQEILEKEK